MTYTTSEPVENRAPTLIYFMRPSCRLSARARQVEICGALFTWGHLPSGRPTLANEPAGQVRAAS